jgi:hypothetical protein
MHLSVNLVRFLGIAIDKGELTLGCNLQHVDDDA